MSGLLSTNERNDPTTLTLAPIYQRKLLRPQENLRTGHCQSKRCSSQTTRGNQSMERASVFCMRAGLIPADGSAKQIHEPESDDLYSRRDNVAASTAALGQTGTKTQRLHKHVGRRVQKGPLNAEEHHLKHPLGTPPPTPLDQKALAADGAC
ncbi:MAG TPA: hypothetical protein VME63_03130 [Dyella sp.]|uniref:hypothetical protein n=1 Tax=Dyella sp. TaxID=1869338 RepID=UPI002D07AB00|nr:hypothetical protein [Dyella sp.]HTV84369.1 hypothetical protein [Dyella sp.]